MNASVKWKSGLSFTGQADSGFSIDLGADPSVGGVNDGFRPLELMVISLAGCTAMDVISILQKKRQLITGFSVDITSERAADHPKVFSHITIHYKVHGRNVDETALVRAIELSAVRYCPAQAMLGKVVPIELVYRLEDEVNGLIKEGRV